MDCIVTPCGKKIDIVQGINGRAYFSNGRLIWDTVYTHRTELLAVMLKEDELRYHERKLEEQNENK